MPLLLPRDDAPPSRRRTTRMRRWTWRNRHLVLALALATTGAVTLTELRPARPPTERVLVLARDIPAGAVLAGDDVVLRHVPAGTVPDGALRDVVDAQGSALAVGLPAGFPLARTVLVGPGLADGAPPGSVVVPVRLADQGVAELLRAGDRVDLLAATSDTAGSAGAAEIVAPSALVLATHRQGASGLLGAGTSTSADASLVLVALTPGTAAAVVGASAWAPLRVVLTAPRR